MLVAAWPAHAAITVVQGTAPSCKAQGAATCTTTGVTTTTGNLFVASSSYCCAAFVSITDSNSNSYGNAVAETADTFGGFIRQDYIASGTGSASHTFTLTGASAAFFGSLSVEEVSGAAASPLDQVQSSHSGPGTSHTSTSTSTTSQANELLIGVGGTIGITTFTNDGGAGWTERTNIATDLSTEGIITGTRIVSAVGTYAYTFTTGSSADTAAGISTWKEASATRQRCIGCGTDKKVIGE